jgi:hypothetical protein
MIELVAIVERGLNVTGMGKPPRVEGVTGSPATLSQALLCMRLDIEQVWMVLVFSVECVVTNAYACDLSCQ